MDEYTKKHFQEIRDEIREGVQAHGLEVGTAEAEAWVRANWPAGEFWAFVAGPAAEQRALGPDAVHIEMNAEPPHPPRTIADYERLAAPEAGD